MKKFDKDEVSIKLLFTVYFFFASIIAPNAFAAISSGGSIVYYADASQTDQGVIGNGRTIKAYIAAIGSTKSAVIELNPNYINNITYFIVSTNLTVPKNITLRIHNGAQLKDDSNNADLIIKGYIEASPEHRIINWGNGTGTITLPGSQPAFPEWFGVTGGTTTDQSANLNRCFNSSKYIILSQIYCVCSNITFSQDNGILQFMNGSKIYLHNSVTEGAPGITVMLLSGNNQRIYNLKLDGNKSNNTSEKATGVYISGNNIHLYSPEVYGVPTIRYSSGDGIFVTADGTRIVNPYVHDNGRNGIAVIQGKDTEITNFRSESNGLFGIDCEAGTGLLIDGVKIIGGYSDNDHYGIGVIGNISSFPISSGSADKDIAYKLVDSGAKFLTDGVKTGCLVLNSTDDKFARVVSVDSETEITLDWNAFPNGNENYSIFNRPIYDATVSGVTIKNTSDRGIVIRSAFNPKIVNNTIINAGLHGIHIETDANYRFTINALIADNFISQITNASGYGIYLNGANKTYYYVRNASINNNIIEGIRTNSAICLAYTRRCSVTNNLIKNSATGISLFMNDAITVKNNQMNEVNKAISEILNK